MEDDRQLMRRLQCGDQDALRRIYKKYRDDLLTVATCLVVDRAAAEDVVHDVFVAFTNGSGVRRNLKGYLTSCVVNRARDHWHRSQRHSQGHRVAVEDVARAASTIAEPVRQLIDREETEALCRALAQLPYEQREVIMLHLHGSMTFKEIARQQGVSINTAQGRYRYALDKLRSLLHTGART